MPYSVVLTGSAQKDFNSLPQEVRDVLLDLIKDFKNFPNTKKESESLNGYEARKLRSGNHRIVFTLNASKQQIVIRLIRSQKEMYLRLADILAQ